MDDDTNLLTAQTNEAADAAEEDAFLAAFGPVPDDKPAKEPKPDEPVKNEKTEQGHTEGNGEASEGDTSTPTPSPALFAGLTEEQIQGALARSGALQATVDKMAGRIGSLMQQVEAFKNTPPQQATQAAAVALDLKLEKLSSSFPELAEMLREDLKVLQSPPVAALTPETPQGITQEQIDAMLNERLGKTQAEMKEQIEMKVLSITHPDWLSVIKTPQFNLWRGNVLSPEEAQSLMASDDSAFIGQYLTKFKAWRDSAPAAAPVQKPKADRLANAVRSQGGQAVAASGPMTEEDAFLAGFKNDRQKHGYAA